jgi:subtilase family serine protease
MTSRSTGRTLRFRLAGLLLALAGVTACGTNATASPDVTPAAAALTAAQSASTFVNCNTPVPNQAHCMSSWHPFSSTARALVATSAKAAATAARPTPGLAPIDIRNAYSQPKTGAKGQVIAIVDAYDNPKAEKDLAVYRSTWKLPACTTKNKCFRKVNQRGTTKPPKADPGWGVEIALDIQAVSATCPGCKILLVESDTPTAASLGAAVNMAAKLGADVISNSYGIDESSSSAALGKKYFTHAKIPMLASSGDSGYGPASYPAVLTSVWGIGGTYLSHTGASLATGWSEQAWQYAGSGCSTVIAKPTAQKDTGCAKRTVADISAVADSDEGFATYDTYGLGADNGWIALSGTSLSAPLIAGMMGHAGHPTTVAKASYPYGHRVGLRDVSGGSNGTCDVTYLCNGVAGYDGPTGLGSPRGLRSLGRP